MSSPIVEKIGSLSRGQAFVGSAILALLYYMFMYNNGANLQKNIAALKKQTTDLQQEIKKYEKAKEDAKAYKLALDEEGPKFAAIVKFLPEELSEFQVMEILSTEAKAVGARVKGTTSSPTKASKDDIYHTISVNMQLELTYTQLLLFLSYITKVDRVISLKSFTISRRNAELDGEALLDVKADFLAYRYNPESDKSEVLKYAK